MAMRNLRNVAIVMLLALVVAFAPPAATSRNRADGDHDGLPGRDRLDAVRLSRQNQLTLATLSDGRRAILYGAFGMIALLIAGSDELFASGGGTLAWILLFAASVAAIYRVWVEANTYLIRARPLANCSPERATRAFRSGTVGGCRHSRRGANSGERGPPRSS